MPTSSPSELKSYHFDVGNSTSGPIGFSARVTARSRKEAVVLLRRELPEEVLVRVGIAGESVEYINVYLNPDALSVADIDFEDG